MVSLSYSLSSSAIPSLLIFLFSFKLMNSLLLLYLPLLLPSIYPFCVFSFTSSLKQLHQTALSHLFLFVLRLAFSYFSASLIPIMVNYCLSYTHYGSLLPLLYPLWLATASLVPIMVSYCHSYTSYGQILPLSYPLWLAAASLIPITVSYCR